jgi:hypothetical protein
VQLRKVVDDKPKVLLIHVKGRRNVVARCAEVSHKSLNKGDAFILVDAAARRVSQYYFLSFTIGSLSNRSLTWIDL